MARNSDLDAMMEQAYTPEEATAAKKGKWTSRDFPTVNTRDPLVREMLVRNLAHMHGYIRRNHPELLQQGRDWYPNVNEAVAKGIRGTGLTHLAGSGVVAAVSPSMDFDRRNIQAFGELVGSRRQGMKGLTSSQWKLIHASAAQPKVFSAEKGRDVPAPRTPEVEDILRGKSISTANDASLVKAHRLLSGESVEDVMPPQTAPKTHAFAYDIHDPSGESHVRSNPGMTGPLITTDGRHFDILTNRRIPWEYSGRGISSAELPTSAAPQFTRQGQQAKRYGNTTRYEDTEEATHRAAELVGEQPIHLQAQAWLGGQRVEREAPTASGGQRVKGEERVGQPYFPELSGAPSSARPSGQPAPQSRRAAFAADL